LGCVVAPAVARLNRFKILAFLEGDGIYKISLCGGLRRNERGNRYINSGRWRKEGRMWVGSSKAND
jgi:hypothetical protein